jgi:DNA adenine methylase
MLETNIHAIGAQQHAAKRADAAPILKWVGGKTRLWPQLASLLPPNVRELRHVEPFVGGAGVFFRALPHRALLADINTQLMATYRCVQRDVEALIERLFTLERAHSESFYYSVRARYNATPICSSVERCAQFIYLNRTCYNGLHRVNRCGGFNVPIGRYSRPSVVNPLQLRAASRLLQGVQLRTGHFREVLEQAGRGDFVYLDSPYDVAPGSRSFTTYATSPFGPEQQDEQADVFRALDRRGCKLMLSNSDTRANRARYAGYEITEVMAPRSISRDGKHRHAVRELVVRNYV